MVFQSRALDIDISVRQNLMYHAALHGIARRARKQAHRTRCWIGWRWLIEARIASEIFRSDRCVVSRSPGHSCTSLACFCSTSRPSASTSRRAPTFSITSEHCQQPKGSGVLWATHLIDEARSTDNVVVLHKGSVLAHGLVNEVIEQSGGTDLRDAFSRLTGSADQNELETAR